MIHNMYSYRIFVQSIRTKYTLEIVLIKNCKKKEKFEKTRHVKINDKSKKYVLRGGRNTRYHDRILCKKGI